MGGGCFFFGQKFLRAVRRDAGEVLRLGHAGLARV